MNYGAMHEAKTPYRKMDMKVATNNWDKHMEMDEVIRCIYCSNIHIADQSTQYPEEKMCGKWCIMDAIHHNNRMH